MKFARSTHLLAGLAAAGLLAACATKSEDDGSATTATPAAPQLIGRIASVPADGGFVLIQAYGSAKIPAGTVLTSRGGEKRSANLLVTGESLGQFTAADLRNGHALVGDGVYSHSAPKAAESAPDPPGEPDAEAQNAGNEEDDETENVQKNN